MIKNFLHFKKKDKRGFTLIELMVATSIFTIIMLTAMSSLFVLLNAAKNSRALRFSMDNVNFAIESMSRSIRMGTNYYCLSSGESIGPRDFLDSSRNCRDGGTLISFIPQESDIDDSYRIIYKLKTRDDSTGTIERCSPDGCVEIISSNVNIERLRFFTFGAEESDKQASVYIIIKGSVLVKNVPIPFSLQTLASMRNF